MSEKWIADSDGKMRLAAPQVGAPAGVSEKEADAELYSPRVTVPTPQVGAPLVNHGLLNTHQGLVRGALALALGRAKSRQVVLLDSWGLAFRESAVDPDLKPEDCTWVSIHGHPVCIHPKSGMAVSHGEGEAKVFNKVQHALIEAALGWNQGYIEGKITAVVMAITKAKAEKSALVLQPSTPETKKKLASLNAAISRGGQDKEALQYALDVITGKIESPEAKAKKKAEADAKMTADTEAAIAKALATGEVDSANVQKLIDAMTDNPSKTGMQNALADWLAANPPAGSTPSIKMSDAVGLNKPQMELYKKVLAGLEDGKFTLGVVQENIAKLSQVASAALDAKTKLQAEGGDAKAIASLGAMVSRCKQEMAALNAALSVYAGQMHPAFAKGEGAPTPKAALAPASPLPAPSALGENGQSVYTSLTGWLKDGTVSVDNVKAGISNATDADIKAGMQKALDEYLAVPSVPAPIVASAPTEPAPALDQVTYDKTYNALKSGVINEAGVTDLLNSFTVSGEVAKADAMKNALADWLWNNKHGAPHDAQLSAYHYTVYQNQLDDLNNGKKSVESTQNAIKYYNDLAASGAAQDKKTKLAGTAYAKQLALATYQGQAIKVTKGATTDLPNAPVGALPIPAKPPLKMGIVLGPNAFAEYSATLASLNKGEVTVEDAIAIKDLYNDGGNMAQAKGYSTMASFKFAQAAAISAAIDVFNGVSAPAFSTDKAEFQPSAPAPISSTPAMTPPAPQTPPSVPPATGPSVASAFTPLKFEAPAVDAPEAKVVFDDKLGGNLVYVGAAGGTQGAKWYKDEKTGNRYVVKSYSDPNRTATEIMANAVYRQMGIPAAESVLTDIDGKRVYATKEIAGKELGETNMAALAPEVQATFRRTMAQGFIVDALLGSRDVVGANKDNILVGKDGAANRIDVGGTMFFRAMGEKKDFPAKVEELQSLLSSNQAGAVYASAGLDDYTMQRGALALQPRLTDGWIDAQVDKAGFSSQMASQVKQSLKERRDYLINQFRPVEQVTPKTVAAIQQMNIQGHGISIGGTAFKGATTQANFELSPSGQKQLVVYGKLRTDAENTLWAHLKDKVASAPKSGAANGGYVDPYHTLIMAAAKTINYHKLGGTKPDNQFNKSTLASFQSAVGGMDPEGNEYKHHKESIEAIQANIPLINANEFSKVTAVPVVSPAPPPPPATEDKAKKVKADDEISITQITSGSGAWERTNDAATGLSKRTQWNNIPLGQAVGSGVHFETPEVEGVYFPSGSKPGVNENPWSRQGYVEIRAKDGTQEMLRAGMARLGIPNHDSTARDAEEAYLSRLAWWLKEDKNSAYVKAHAVPDPDERLLAKRAALSKMAGVKDITALPDYSFVPKHDSRGTSYFEAPQIPQVTEHMPDTLYHGLKAGNWKATADSMLNSGVHSMESTEARLRKGLFLSGMSSTEDQSTGGAGHLFFYFGKGGKSGSITMDGRIMRRLDSYAHNSDKYGNLKDYADQRVKPGSFDHHVNGWEATVNGGVGFDYARAVYVDSSSSVQDVIDKFKQMGITHMGQAYHPGGIPIEKIVKVKEKS